MREITDKNMIVFILQSLVTKQHIIITIIENSGETISGTVNGYVNSYELNGKTITAGVEIHNNETIT